MSNFVFFARFDPQLAKIGGDTERRLYSDPSTFLFKLHAFAEFLASRITKEEDVDLLDEQSFYNTLTTVEQMGESYASKSPAVWPSEASAIRVDTTLFVIVGRCHRAAYERMMGFSITHSADATSAWRWVMGRQIESNLTEQASLASIYAACGIFAIDMKTGAHDDGFFNCSEHAKTESRPIAA